MHIYVNENSSKQQVTLLKTNLLQNQWIGSKLFYNFYYTKIDDKKSFKLIGNTTNPSKTKVRNCL